MYILVKDDDYKWYLCYRKYINSVMILRCIIFFNVCVVYVWLLKLYIWLFYSLIDCSWKND